MVTENQTWLPQLCVLKGPKIGRNCYTCPAFSAVPNTKRAGGGDQKWLSHPYLLKGPKESGTATQPLHSEGSPTRKAGRKLEVVAPPLPSRGPKRGRNCCVNPAFSRVPNAKHGEEIRRAPKMAELLCNRRILEGPEGPNTKHGEEITGGYLTTAFSGGPKEGGIAK